MTGHICKSFMWKNNCFLRELYMTGEQLKYSINTFPNEEILYLSYSTTNTAFVILKHKYCSCHTQPQILYFMPAILDFFRKISKVTIDYNVLVAILLIKLYFRNS